jgi:hypothetical protein
MLGALAPWMLATACAVESGPTTSGVSSWGGSSSSGGGGPAGDVPALVVVDTNAVMNVNGGDGVGVFIEYASGGHWHVSWTCDTNKTGLGCHFDNMVSVASGRISKAAVQGVDNPDQFAQPSMTELEVAATASTTLEGITFDTDPGAVITLDARLNGAEEGAILFFVQDGVVNGGYPGVFADPLMLQPSAP